MGTLTSTLSPTETNTGKQEEVIFETTSLPPNRPDELSSTSQGFILSTLTTMPSQTVSSITRLTSETNDRPLSTEQANTIKQSISESTTPLPTTTTLEGTQTTAIPETKSIERSTHMPSSFFEDTISTIAPMAETTHKPTKQAQSEVMEHQSKSLNMQIGDDMTGHDLDEGSGVLTSQEDSTNFRPDLAENTIKENTIYTNIEDSERRGREKEPRQLVIKKEEKQHKDDDKIIFINGRRASIKKRRRGKLIPKKSRK